MRGAAAIATLRAMKYALLASTLLVACSHPKPAPAPTAAPGPAAPPAAAAVQPEIHPFKIGALDAVALRDGALQLPNDGKLVALGHDPKEVAALLTAAGQPGDHFDLSIQPLLVKDGAHTLLFDTGIGDPAHGGLLPKSLALAGVAPAAITDIFISHAHGDHVGGLVDQATGGLAFPNAAIHLQAAEWAALQDKAKTDADAKKLATAIAAKVAPFEPGAQLLPEVKAIDTHGHTPGHSSYDIASNGEHLVYLGDVAHSFVVSVQQPSWPIGFDNDKDLAAKVRHDTLHDLATTKLRVYAVHFPWPGLGHVVGEGDALRWDAEK